MLGLNRKESRQSLYLGSPKMKLTSTQLSRAILVGMNGFIRVAVVVAVELLQQHHHQLSSSCP